MRETQIMHEMRHPNVMPLYCSFVHKEQLWMVMPYVAGGSLFSIMQAGFPQVHSTGMQMLSRTCVYLVPSGIAIVYQKLPSEGMSSLCSGTRRGDCCHGSVGCAAWA